MKQYRLRFQREFHAKIIAGEKTATMRWGKPKPFQVGDVIALTEGVYTKYADAFAYARVVEKQSITWGDVTEVMLAQTGVNRDWYLSRYPDMKPQDTGEFIRFELVEVPRG